MSLRNPQEFALGFLLLVGCVLGWVASQTLPSPAQAAQADKGMGTARYTVVDTEGTNLIVTDNQTNTLYFYTIDKDAQIGSDLKLRGSLDLTDVGKPTLKPKVMK